MAEDIGNHLGMNTLASELRRERVPEIVPAADALAIIRYDYLSVEYVRRLGKR